MDKYYYGVIPFFPDVNEDKIQLMWKKFKINANSTWCSEAVTNPSTNRAQRWLSAVIKREPVFTTWYGRWQHSNIDSLKYVHLFLYATHYLIILSRSSIRKALKIYIWPVVKRKWVFWDFHLQAVARRLAAGTALEMRDGEGSVVTSFTFCFPLWWGTLWLRSSREQLGFVYAVGLPCVWSLDPAVLLCVEWRPGPFVVR